MISWSFDIQTSTAETLGVYDWETLPIRDLALDRNTLDLEVPIRIIGGLEAIAQRLWIRLNRISGSWFLDQRIGVPYLTQILGTKRASVPLISAILRRVILETPGISGVEDFRLDLGPDRILKCSFNALARGGTETRAIAFVGAQGANNG